MVPLILAAVMGVLNAAGGARIMPLGRAGVAGLFGMAVGICGYAMDDDFLQAMLLAFISTIGVLFWLMSGYGLYSGAYTRMWNPHERGVPWIDDVVGCMVPFRTGFPHEANALRGVLAMCLQGLYLIPGFLWLSLAFGGVSCWWLGLLGIVQGLLWGMNRVAWRRLGPLLPHIFMGATVGLLYGIALNIIL